MKIIGCIIAIAVLFLGMCIGGLNGNTPEEFLVLLALLGVILGAYLIYKSQHKE
ncbi:hypothetical protein [Myroides odoratimimus]|uniref:hypothetical protein n=1 Tax=Myroides odoratimimus TaxID=76832 RepID=UPI002DBF906D|nr:hypothetical protein [Myroides odoratimimus]MEC4086565.1 hypothetical protein [Myroides odoratimimus]